jgi:hypothetical protein
MYRQAFQELLSGFGTTVSYWWNSSGRSQKDANILQVTATTLPVIYQSHNLFNPLIWDTDRS